MYTYICTKGHIQVDPQEAAIGHCTHREPVVNTNGLRIGWCPCNTAVARLPLDPDLEAAYRIGGPDAVMAELRHRLEPRAAA